MSLDKHARPIIAVVILITILLAALSYILPGTFAAYLFPGIAGGNVGDVTGRPLDILETANGVIYKVIGTAP